jgi:hypothetical protein
VCIGVYFCLFPNLLLLSRASLSPINSLDLAVGFMLFLWENSLFFRES